MTFSRAIRLRWMLAAALPVVGAGQVVWAVDAPQLAIPVAETARVTQSVNAGSVVAIANTRSALALHGATALGAVDGSIQMNHMQLVLKRSDARTAALNAFVAAQQNPHSGQFHQWLTAQEYGQRFGVLDADIKTVTSWLASSGFKVNGVYPNKMQIDFSGTVAKVNSAFHTRQTRYAGRGLSETHIANATDISIPAALAPVVAGVAGLSDLRPHPFHTVTHADKFTVTASSASAKIPYATAKKTQAASSNASAAQMSAATKGDAIPVKTSSGLSGRFLVPADMQVIYDTAPLLNKGVNGSGLTIAVVEDEGMVPGDWFDFVNTFYLPTQYSQFSQVFPAPPAGVAANCFDPGNETAADESLETVLDAEWTTAMAPRANIVVAVCSDYATDGQTPSTQNFFGGVYLAALNLINGTQTPDVISASYGYGEDQVDSGSKTQLDNMWQQAAAEGISVFVSSGDTGSNPDFNDGPALITAPSSVNALASSQWVTAVGGTDFADMLDGTSAQYFSNTPDFRFGTAKSYVPEIPWNSSCGNDVAATDSGFDSAMDFCQAILQQAGGAQAFFTYTDEYQQTPNPDVFTPSASSGGVSTVDAKPSWQNVYGVPSDGMRDIPDVALYGGSFTFQAVVICMASEPCNKGGFPNGVAGVYGTSLSSPMFAGIQALVDQSASGRQGVAAPVLYAIASQTYGSASATSAPASLAVCSTDNPNVASSGCVFHNVLRGGISSNCFTPTGNCTGGLAAAGLTTQTADGSSYVEYAAQPGWSFASGLGSVDAANLANAWVAYLSASPASQAQH
jgi:subtilase family serine protease